MLKIKRDDEVIVLAGKDKGKQGKVLKVLDDKLLISGINMVKRHTKPNPQAGVAGPQRARDPLGEVPRVVDSRAEENAVYSLRTV